MCAATAVRLSMTELRGARLPTALSRRCGSLIRFHAERRLDNSQGLPTLGRALKLAV